MGPATAAAARHAGSSRGGGAASRRVPDKPADNIYRYNAKCWDPVTGSYDMGFRDHNPA